ncbi:SCO family protein [Streptomyces sp. NPDC051940]|uniref:SCO family protein n=1 Tax=Streptomyces sp. NPDC051940 TaxID=3155675 RepID=UPI003416BB15
MRIPRTALALATAALLTAGLAACGSGEPEATPAVEISGGQTKPGTVLDDPKAKPALVLTDTKGRKYDLVKETAGRPTLVFFGYTHCPDVCPTTMSDLAIAKAKLPKADQDRLRVVFVTTDPEHDTPQRLGEWLASQDKDFIGLTGDFAAIQAAGQSLGVMVEKATVDKDGTITADHGAQVLAFSPKDDKAHVIYTAGTTADDYAKDLPVLVQGGTP